MIRSFNFVIHLFIITKVVLGEIEDPAPNPFALNCLNCQISRRMKAISILQQAGTPQILRIALSPNRDQLKI